MKFFEQGEENAINPEGTISEDDVYFLSEAERKRVWIREKMIKHLMQMELDNCSNELVWLIRCHNCAAANCSEDEYPLRPLLIPPDCIDILQRRLGKTKNNILPLTVKMVLRTYYPLPSRQAPVHPQHQKISSYSQEEQL